MSDLATDTTPYVLDAGTGPDVLLLHGIGGSADTFAPQLDALKNDFRLLAWDAPGYARSTDPGQPMSLDDYADVAAEVIRAYCSDGAHVLGMSWGGIIAVHLAHRHPELVRSLILGDSTVGSASSESKVAEMRGRAEELQQLGPQEFARRRSVRLLSTAAPDDLRKQAETIMADAVRLPGYGYAAETMATTDHTGVLASIDTPTLVLCGDEDQVTGQPASQPLAGGIPGAVFVTVRGAGHLANQERPEAFNAWVSSFIQITERLHG